MPVDDSQVNSAPNEGRLQLYMWTQLRFFRVVWAAWPLRRRSRFHTHFLSPSTRGVPTCEEPADITEASGAFRGAGEARGGVTACSLSKRGSEKRFLSL